MDSTKPQITQAVKSSVNAYLMARAYAETMREKVDPFYTEALAIHPIYTDLTTRANTEVERIYNREQMFLSEDDETCKEIYADVNFHLRKAGLKPDNMPDSHCPALVAEHLQIKTEHILIDAAAEMLGENGEFRHTLLCNGLGAYKKFIDLVVKLVVNMPDFKNPLTGN